jgi:hypothetical protein
VTEPGAPAAVAASRRLDRPAAWLAAMAALLVVAVAGTALLVNGQRDAQLAARNDEIAARTAQIASLERIAAAGLRVAAEPDATHVTLAAADGGDAAGSLVFSPATRELVVLASGLTKPGNGREFRCWVEVDGERRPVGRMFFADDLAFWAGPVDAVADLPAGATFGVTLVDAGGTSLDGPATLSGAL